MTIQHFGDHLHTHAQIIFIKYAIFGTLKEIFIRWKKNILTYKKKRKIAIDQCKIVAYINADYNGVKGKHNKFKGSDEKTVKKQHKYVLLFFLFSV